MKESKELMSKEASELAVSPAMMECELDAVSSSDIVIPKLQMMQAMSSMVQEDIAKPGEFRNSLTQELLPNPLRFTVVNLKKVWFCKKKVGGDFKFEHVEDCTAANEGRPWNEVINGEEWNYTKSYNFYIVTPESQLPLVLGMQGTSVKTAKKLITQISVLNKMAKLNMFGMQLELTNKKEKNDRGSYYVYDFKPVERSTAEEMNNAYEWYKNLKSSNIKEDTSDMEATQATEEPVF